jgi:ferredoxin-NADP reductase
VAGDAGYEVVVRSRRAVADGIDAWELGFADGRDLPAWRPGAHLDVLVPADADDPGGPVLERQYSLCGDPADRGAWRIAVLREPGGRGGSERLHRILEVGMVLRVRGPRNRFPLDPSPAYAFVAAGIGITALLPMVRAAAAQGADWTLDYAGRSRRTMAFAAELVADHGDRVRLHPGDEGVRLDLAAVLAARPAGAPVYACGPARLVDALEELTATAPPGTLRTERFTARELGEAVLQEPFEVELAMTGVTVTVPPDRSILEVAEEAGALVLASCREGTCGTCETPVLEGSVEHRDSVLTLEEQAEDRVMMVCVSRSRCPRLVLDL